MLKIYKYTYYRAYDLLKLRGNFDLAWGASHYLALFYGLFSVNLILNFSRPNEKIWMKVLGIAIFFLIHVLNYFLFLKDGKYKSIIEHYGKESKRQGTIGKWATVIVTIGLIYSLF